MGGGGVKGQIITLQTSIQEPVIIWQPEFLLHLWQISCLNESHEEFGGTIGKIIASVDSSSP